MPFYDNYFSRSDSISSIGKRIIAREVQNRIALSQRFRHQKALKTLEFGPGRGHFARAAEGIDVVQSFVPPMPEDVGSGYDLVLMEHFIEHMDSPASARELVESVHQSLAKDGLILIVSPDYLAHRSNFWDCDYTHAFVTTNQRLRQLLVDCNYEVCYAGYETLGIQNPFVTWLISELTHLAFFTRLPQLLSLLLKGSTALSNKWKNVLLRSCVMVGQRRSW
jgi:hypothetical protein